MFKSWFQEYNKYLEWKRLYKVIIPMRKMFNQVKCYTS